MAIFFLILNPSIFCLGQFSEFHRQITLPEQTTDTQSKRFAYKILVLVFKNICIEIKLCKVLLWSEWQHFTLILKL